MKTDTLTKVHHGAGSNNYMAKNLDDATNRAVKAGKFFGLPGILSVSGPDGQVATNPNAQDPTINSNKSVVDENDGLGVAAKVVIPIAAVTLFLLAILLLRRRHRETTHVKGQDDSLLDYETDEETSANRAMFVYDDDTLSSGDVDDSYYGDSMLGKNHSTMDVHVCQSSLCEVCEKRDQHGGISFIKTGAPPMSPERLPPDAGASRDYSTSDTVSL